MRKLVTLLLFMIAVALCFMASGQPMLPLPPTNTTPRTNRVHLTNAQPVIPITYTTSYMTAEWQGMAPRYRVLWTSNLKSWTLITNTTNTRAIIPFISPGLNAVTVASTINTN